MGTECLISVLAAELEVTGSMAVVLGCLLPACLKKRLITREGDRLQLEFHFLSNFCCIGIQIFNYVHK